MNIINLENLSSILYEKFIGLFVVLERRVSLAQRRARLPWILRLWFQIILPDKARVRYPSIFSSPLSSPSSYFKHEIVVPSTQVSKEPSECAGFATLQALHACL